MQFVEPIGRGDSNPRGTCLFVRNADSSITSTAMSFSSESPTRAVIALTPSKVTSREVSDDGGETSNEQSKRFTVTWVLSLGTTDSKA